MLVAKGWAEGCEGGGAKGGRHTVDAAVPTAIATAAAAAAGNRPVARVPAARPPAPAVCQARKEVLPARRGAAPMLRRGRGRSGSNAPPLPVTKPPPLPTQPGLGGRQHAGVAAGLQRATDFDARRVDGPRRPIKGRAIFKKPNGPEERATPQPPLTLFKMQRCR